MVQPLAMACWDLSWLLHRDLRDGAFASLERVLDDTQLRGFNALRVDPCPHLIASPENGIHLDRCELIPSHGQPVEVKIRHALQQLMQSTHERGMKLWFSSHFINDSRARRSFVRRPADYVAVWSDTLSLIQEWGYLDDVAGVDFCYQFPSLPAAHGVTRRVFGRSPERGLPSRWSPTAAERLEAYLLEVPRALHALFPSVPVGLSTTSALSEQLRQLDTSELDFLDFSLWLDEDPRYRLATGEAMPMSGLLGRLASPVKQVLLDAAGTHWQRRLEEQLQRRMAFTRLRRLSPVLGNGFVRQPRGLRSMPTGWADLHEMMVVNALTQGVDAMTPTSLASPHYDWLWQEQDYLAHLNHMILAGAR
ncbi:cellulase [Alcanivorax sp. P2S70]|nr:MULTISPECIES: cellulase-like family protein [Alcanivorax]ERP89589.1 cellulase [Alcanivorax sp. P2S70]